jgi:hypothetical protein
LFLSQHGLYIKNHYIKCNKKLKQIVVYDGELYGLYKNQLVFFDTDYDESDYWAFKSVSWAPKNIKYINTTLDNNYMFIQTDKKCYMYNNNKRLKLDCCNKRVYGNDSKTYLEFNTNQCRIVIDDKCVNVVDDVLSGVIDHNNNIYFLHRNDQYIYKDIKMVNHKPYYINL